MNGDRPGKPPKPPLKRPPRGTNSLEGLQGGQTAWEALSWGGRTQRKDALNPFT